MPHNAERRPGGGYAAEVRRPRNLPQRSPTDRDNPDPIVTRDRLAAGGAFTDRGDQA